MLELVKVHISKQIPYLVSLNTLVIQSIKISGELIVYFVIKIKNSEHRGGPCNIYVSFFRGCQSLIFSFLYVRDKLV